MGWKVAGRTLMDLEDEAEAGLRKEMARRLSWEMAWRRGVKEAMWTVHGGRRRNSWATARHTEAWPSSLLVRKRMTGIWMVGRRGG